MKLRSRPVGFQHIPLVRPPVSIVPPVITVCISRKRAGGGVPASGGPSDPRREGLPGIRGKVALHLNSTEDLSAELHNEAHNS